MNDPASAVSAAARKARENLLDGIARNLGPMVLEALNDPEVIEIMLNPDGGLWVERFGQPMLLAGSLSPEQAGLAVTLIASALKAPATRETPIIEGELPLDGSRFEGLIPPVTAAPCFTIRKKASKIFTLGDYVQAGNLSLEARDLLEEAVLKRRSLLVAGGTGSGKTTFVNAVIEAVARLTPQDRLVVIEDTAELQSSSPNRVELHTTDFVDMGRLLKATLRLRPDRILVGEVRDVAALALVKAWNTGHTGGVATVHANSAREALGRLEQLIAEGRYQPLRETLAEAVDYVVFLKKDGAGFRRVTEIAQVGYAPELKDYRFDYPYRA